MTVIVRPWVPGWRGDDQRASRHAAARARRNGYLVNEIPCRQPSDWPFAFRYAFNDAANLDEDLVVIEHDIVPTLPQLELLTECDEPAAACVFAYRLYPGTDYNASDRPVWVHRRLVGGDPTFLAGAGVFVTDGADDPRIPRTAWIGDLEQRCDLAGFGLIRFRRAARAVELPKLSSWVHMDTRVSAALLAALGRSWCHVHWPPVRHDHATGSNQPSTAPVTPVRL